MTFEHFTDRAHKVMQLANQEAQRFNHEYTGTEHILLGLVKEGSGVAANVLKNLDIDLRKIRLEVEKLMVVSNSSMVTMGKLPYTARAEKAILDAIDAAREMEHSYIGTEHLLLGILNGEGGAVQVLANLGMTKEKIRDDIKTLLNIPAANTPQGVPIPTGSMLSREREIRERLDRYTAAYLGQQVPGWLHDYASDVQWLLERLNAPHFIMEYKPPTEEEREALRKAAEQISGMTDSAMPNVMRNAYIDARVAAMGLNPPSEEDAVVNPMSPPEVARQAMMGKGSESAVMTSRPGELSSEEGGLSVTIIGGRLISPDAASEELTHLRERERAEHERWAAYTQGSANAVNTAMKQQRERILSLLDAILITQDSAAARAALALLRSRIADS